MRAYHGRKTKKRKSDELGSAGPSSSSCHYPTSSVPGPTPLLFTYGSDSDSDSLRESEKDDVISEIEVFRQMPKIFDIRFRSLCTSLGALLESEPIFTTLHAIRDQNFELVNHSLNWELIRSLYEILRVIIQKLQIFDSDSRNMGSYLEVFFDLLA